VVANHKKPGANAPAPIHPRPKGRGFPARNR
jgi:hypothetical protein